MTFDQMLKDFHQRYPNAREGKTLNKYRDFDIDWKQDPSDPDRFWGTGIKGGKYIAGYNKELEIITIGDKSDI